MRHLFQGANILRPSRMTRTLYSRARQRLQLAAYVQWTQTVKFKVFCSVLQKLLRYFAYLNREKSPASGASEGNPRCIKKPRSRHGPRRGEPSEVSSSF